ncbi:sce7726 family protein [Campylobacter sp. 7477a]|uniref:sce7726 family protein n=1 Tax=Campylobacter sp. 7477a TaxID=2735741 RepID=UPI00301425C1|nr:sce7726 family protein [Campylobacter sp. 7477a]
MKNKNSKVDANAIKKCLIDWLDKKYINKTITSEILVKTSIGDKIADIVVSNGHTIAYEIKSELDTAIRLNDQLNGFSEVFEYVNFVFWRDRFDINKLNIPLNTGIIEAFYQNNMISFKVIKKPKINKNISKQNLSSMLWVDELKYFLEQKNINFKGHLDKRALVDKFCEITSNKEAVKAFRFALRYRYENGFLEYKKNKDNKNALYFLLKNKINRQYLLNFS